MGRVRRPAPLLFTLIGSLVLVVPGAHGSRSASAAEPARKREGAAVVLIYDASYSMLADDVSPTRSDVALAASLAFISAVPRPVLIGLVSIGGEPAVNLRVEPTTKRNRVRDELMEIRHGYTSELSEAVVLALGALQSYQEASIVIVSDGTDNSDPPRIRDAPRIARRAHRPVSTVVIGTKHAEVLLPDGSIEEMPMSTRFADAMADATGGTYVTVTTAKSATRATRELADELRH